MSSIQIRIFLILMSDELYNKLAARVLRADTHNPERSIMNFNLNVIYRGDKNVK